MSSSSHKSVALQDIAQVPGTCASFNLRRADRLVTQLYDDALRPAGLKSTQFTLLTAIRLNEPATINHLAEGMVTDRTTLTRNLRPLEKEGLIRIAPGSQDRRVREVSMTAQGRQVLERAYPLWQQAQGRIAERLGGQRMEQLIGDLSSAVDAIRD